MKKRTKKVILTMGILGVLAAAAPAAGTVFGIRTVEEAAYEVVSADGEFEVRAYRPSRVARTQVTESGYSDAGRTAFRRLAGYIFGGNRDGESIAMTAPVLQESNDAGWEMTFVLPSGLDTPPLPSDASVTIADMPARKVVALRYTGLLGKASIEEHAARLMDWVERNGYGAVSKPFSAAFDPPWTIPFLRRNEVQVEIE